MIMADIAMVVNLLIMVIAYGYLSVSITKDQVKIRKRLDDMKVIITTLLVNDKYRIYEELISKEQYDLAEKIKKTIDRDLEFLKEEIIKINRNKKSEK